MEPKLGLSGDTRKLMYVSTETKRSIFGCHGTGRWVGCVLGLVSVCSIVVNVSLLFMYTGLHNEVARQKILVDKINSALPVQHDGTYPKWVLNSDDVHLAKRNYRRHGHNKQKRGRRTRDLYSDIIRHLEQSSRPLCIPLERPAIHLRGSGKSPESRNNAFLHWHIPSHHYLTTFNYTFPTADTSSQVVDGIVIVKPGWYVLYSQVAFNGKSIINTPIKECGHEIIRERRNEFRLLLKSMSTQDRSGHEYPMTGASGTLYPLDTHNQMGVFPLRRGDVLKARVSPYCQRYARVRMNDTYTHFGAYMTSDLFYPNTRSSRDPVPD